MQADRDLDSYSPPLSEEGRGVDGGKSALQQAMASIPLDNESSVHHEEDKARGHGEDQGDAEDHGDEGEDASPQNTEEIHDGRKGPGKAASLSSASPGKASELKS